MVIVFGVEVVFDRFRHSSEGNSCGKLFDERHAAARVERIGRVVTTFSRGAARYFGGNGRVRLIWGSTALNPLASVYGPCRSPRHDDRKGKWRDHPGKGSRRTFRLSLTTEKMLSAISEMSNIFLQRGQNIDIAHKNRLLSHTNFGRWGGLAFYLH
jgi:hypothetical protein